MNCMDNKNMVMPNSWYLANIMFFLVLLTGCNERQSEFSALLDKAELLMETSPVSAMKLVDSLFYYSKGTGRHESMRYMVVRARARHENHLPLEDTVILDAARYFANHPEDPRLSAQAYLYSGYTCYELLEDHERAMDYFRKAEAMGAVELGTVLAGLNEQEKSRPTYERNPEDDLKQLMNNYINHIMLSQRRVLKLMGVVLVVAIALLLVLGRMLREKNAKLRIMKNMDVLRKTTRDLLVSQDINYQKAQESRNLLQWKFDVIKEALQLKYGMSEKLRKENQILLDLFDKIVFTSEYRSPLSEFLSVIENLSPGLPVFLEEQYPDLSEREYSVCLLSYAGLSVKEISSLLGLSENLIYKSRSSINKKIGNNFCAVLAEELERSNGRLGVQQVLTPS